MKWTLEDDRQDPYWEYSQSSEKPSALVDCCKKEPHFILDDRHMPTDISEPKGTKPRPGTKADPKE